jgi:mediator of RNA polymerase II transcription subunit 15
MGQMASRVTFPPGFVAHPNMQAAPSGRTMTQGPPRNEMFLVQQPSIGMVRPGGQPNYVMMPQTQLQMSMYRQPMPGPGGMPFPNTLDVPSVGTLPSPAMGGGGGGGGLPGSGSMVSPGIIPSSHSPGPTAGIIPSPASAPSPGSALNTPGNPGSAGAHNEEQAYLEKWNQLQKYVEPLKRMINRIDKDEDRQRDLNKMKNLLDILSDSSKRLPYATLLKCETVLEKLEFSNKANQPPASTAAVPVAPLGGASEHMCQPLLDAVAVHLKSPTLNHTLQRTFGPAVRALHGPPLRTNSPPAKRQCVNKIDDLMCPDDDIPDVIQGEIAQLHRRFIVCLDPSHHPGSKVVHLICRLEDKKLPNVPPIVVTLPENYPDNSPTCKTLPSHYNSTPFLRKVNEILTTEIKHMPGRYSLTALLNMWDICIRKACAPLAITA